MAETKTQSRNEKPPRSKHRFLKERIVVTGELELTSPASFSNGDSDELTDLPLLVDEVDGRALITGASLAGALRNYLRERQCGYERKMPPRDLQARYYPDWTGAENDLLAGILFGGHRGSADGDQSPLIVDDARSETKGRPEIEMRDGVKIAPKTRTAEEKKKYDYQLLPAGTRFCLRFELLLDDKEEKTGKNSRRLKSLAIALRGLAGRRLEDGEVQNGEIRLGARKQRGFGCCRVAKWTVTFYDLKNPKDLCAWLTADYQKEEKHKDWRSSHHPRKVSGADIAELLGVELSEDDLSDLRDDFEIEADCELDGSILVRSGFNEQDRGLDTTHLRTRSTKDKQSHPALPGTSVAGAIRQRALRIANTLISGSDKAEQLIDEMFGPAEIKSGDDARASRVLVNEEFIREGLDRVQTRIKIDRFTGGTIESALLEEAPHFGGTVKLRLSLRNPEDAEIGLLLLVLKDLWLGDLPLGGEANVGRGRLRGVKARLRRSGQDEIVMSATTNDGGVQLSDVNAAARLEACVNALLAEVKQ